MGQITHADVAEHAKPVQWLASDPIQTGGVTASGHRLGVLRTDAACRVIASRP